jgi:hypothetical protein
VNNATQLAFGQLTPTDQLIVQLIRPVYVRRGGPWRYSISTSQHRHHAAPLQKRYRDRL